MIALIDTLDRGSCRHCGYPIELQQSDLDITPHWVHVPFTGAVFLTECPNTTYAAPAESSREHAPNPWSHDK